MMPFCMHYSGRKRNVIPIQSFDCLALHLIVWGLKAAATIFLIFDIVFFCDAFIERVTALMKQIKTIFYSIFIKRQITDDWNLRKLNWILWAPIMLNNILQIQVFPLQAFLVIFCTQSKEPLIEIRCYNSFRPKTINTHELNTYFSYIFLLFSRTIYTMFEPYRYSYRHLQNLPSRLC